MLDLTLNTKIHVHFLLIQAAPFEDPGVPILYNCVKKNFSASFCIKITTYMYIKYNNYKILFFIFLFYNTLTTKFDGNALARKTKPFFFRLENFVDKTTLH